jgi:hypothetical protein
MNADELLTERHYSVPEIAKAWAMGDDTVRRLFADEPGVIRLGQGSRLVGRGKYKRRYHHLRIPGSVLLRVHSRLTAKNAERAS